MGRMGVGLREMQLQRNAYRACWQDAEVVGLARVGF